MNFWLAMATHGEPDNCVTSGSGVEGQSQVVVKRWVGWVAVPRYSRSAVGKDSTWSELLFVSVCRMLTKYIVSCKPLALSSLWCDESWGMWRPWLSEPAGLPSDVCQFDHCMVNLWVKGISHLPSMWWHLLLILWVSSSDFRRPVWNCNYCGEAASLLPVCLMSYPRHPDAYWARSFLRSGCFTVDDTGTRGSQD